MNFFENSFFKRAYQKITGIKYNISYAQTGEDIIIDFLMHARKLKDFTYLDIGANHPIHFNNTYKFYAAGYTGVCIEPDPDVFALLKKTRPRDVCINIGIGGTAAGEADFYVMNNPVLSTFSKNEAELLEKNKQATIKRKVKIALRTVEEVITENFKGKAPVFVNIDVEGLDEEILRNFPFHTYRPKIFCIETVHYTDDASSKKRTEIFDLLKQQGYDPFADTYLNTIFIDAKENSKG